MSKYATPAFDPATARPYEAQLMQLLETTSDGDLISKSARDLIVDNGQAVRQDGFQVITDQGIKYLKILGLIHV